MDGKTKEWLEQRVEITSRIIERIGLRHTEKLVDAFRFDNRKNNFDECKIYEDGKFCHDNGNGQDKYCLLCACLNYDAFAEYGECKIGNPLDAGEIMDRAIFGMKNIWDCKNCVYPHTREATEKALKIVLKKFDVDGEELEDILFDLFTGKLVNEKV